MLLFLYVPVTPTLSLGNFSKAIKTNRTLHVQTKKLASPGRPGESLAHKDSRPRRPGRSGQGHRTARAPGPGTQGREPTGQPGPARRVRPGAEFSVEPERMGAGRSGSSLQRASFEPRLVFLPGFPAKGSPPGRGIRASGFLSRAVRGPGGRGGRASCVQPAAPESAFDASPAPHNKMATWTEGEPGPRGWGRERGGERRQKQKGGPPERRGPPASPGRRAPGRAGGEQGLTFSCRSRLRRPPWRVGRRDAFTAVAPQALSGLSAGFLHTRGEERHVQRCETPREIRGRRSRRQSQDSGLGSPEPSLGLLVKARPDDWLEPRRGRSSRPLRRGGSVLCGAEAAAGGGQERRRARGRAGEQGGKCRGRAHPRSPARAPASPPHLRGRRVPWKPIVRDAGDQAPPQPTSVSANQESVSWGTAGTRYRAHVLVCVQLRRKEKGSGVRPAWVGDPALGRQWLTLGGAAEKGFQCVGPESASRFLLSVQRVSRSLSPRRLCSAGLPPALPSPSSKKCGRFAQRGYNGVFFARLPNHGPGHQPHSARENTRVSALPTKFLWRSLISEWKQKIYITQIAMCVSLSKEVVKVAGKSLNLKLF